MKLAKWLAVWQRIAQMPKRYFGALAGVVLWLLIETVGFFPTLLLAIFVVIGYTLGRFFDGRANWQELLERWWNSDRFE